MNWTPEQLALRNHYRDLGAQLVLPTAAERDRDLSFDRQLWQTVAATGLFGLHMPPRYGGQGRDVHDFAAALEGFAEGCRDIGFLVSIVAQVGLVQAALVSYGNEAQRERWLPSMIRGESIGCFAITEPHAGSDVRALKLTAHREDGGYRLVGEKWNITNAPVADVCLTFARVPGLGKHDITCFLVETDAEGLQQSAPFDLMGNRGTPVGRLEFNDVKLPVNAVLGKEGRGLDVLYFAFLVERVLTGVCLVGSLQPLLTDGVQRALEREAFGQPIGNYQYVQQGLVEIYMNLELLRGIVARAVDAMASGQDCSALASVAKLFATESFHSACVQAIRLHGNFGYRKDHPYERLCRDSIGVFFAGGTAEIHKRILWESLVRDVQAAPERQRELRLDSYVRKATPELEELEA